MADERADAPRRGLWPSFSHSGASSPRAAADDAIAVIGFTGRFPRAATVEELWDRLRNGEDCVTEVPESRWERARTFRLPTSCRWGGFIDDFDKFDVPFFEIDWAACTDPQERVLLEGVWHLLERSGYTRRRLLDACESAVGCYIGVMNADYSHLKVPSSWWLEAMISSLHHGCIANRISHFFDLRGPSMAFDALCSSAAVALHMACQDLRSGNCKMAIAGGVNLILHPDRYEYASLSKHLATRENSRSFSDGDGYIPAEAAGVMLLKPLARAVQDGDNILGVVRASVMNHSGRAAGFGVPNPDAQAEVIDACLKKAGVDPRSVGYIEASATGAALGDPLELAALRRVFAKNGVRAGGWPIGSVKSNLGHAEAASAITQVAKVLLQFEHGQLAPSIRSDPPNPRVNWADSPFRIVRELQDWERGAAEAGRLEPQPRRALLNSFGAGGANVSVLLEEYVPARVAEAARPAQIAPARDEVIILSARNPQRLRDLIERMLAFVSGSADLDIEDLAYTLQFAREAMKARVAIVAGNREAVIAGLTACLRSSLEAAGQIESEVPAFFGEVAGANLFNRHASERGQGEADLVGYPPSRLALEWTQGKSIPWPSLWRKRGRLLMLPTYPFARERCWVKVLTHDHPALLTDPSPMIRDPGMLAEPPRTPPPPLPERQRERAPYLAPRNALEQSLVQIWEEVTHVPGIGVRDSFFEVGGDSMLASLVISRCQESFGVAIDVALLLGREGTIERLAVATVTALASAQSADDNAVNGMIDEVMNGTALVKDPTLGNEATR